MEKQEPQKEKQELKVQDLIPLTDKNVKEIQDSLVRLSILTEEYSKSKDFFSLEFLEDLKRRYISELQYYTTLFSKVRKFKGESYTYLTETRKRVKSEGVAILMGEGFKQTMAMEMVYCSEYYKDRITLIQKLIEFFIKAENLFDFYTYTLQSIVQSVSVAAKEKVTSNQQTYGSY